MESIIVINLNFKKIRNEYVRCMLLIINFVAFLLKFNQSQIDYGELFYFFYCLIIFEFSLKIKKDLFLLKPGKLKMKDIIKKKETKENLQENKSDLIFFNKPIKEKKDLDLAYN